MWKLQFSAVLLALGIALSTFLGLQAKDRADQAVLIEMQQDSSKVADEIREKLNACSAALLAGAALFSVHPNVSRQDWHHFVSSLNLGRDVCGDLGLGFARALRGVELADHEAQVRRGGLPAYQVRPEGARDLMGPVVYMEPENPNNQRAFGFDMYSEPLRRAAMDNARDTGKVSITRGVHLVRDNALESEPSILMVAPVYRTGLPLSTTQQRRAALSGWIFSPHHIRRMMAPFSARFSATSTGTLEMDIYDSPQESDAAQLYDSGGPHTPLAHSMFFHKRKVQLNDSVWWLEFDRNPLSEPISYLTAWLFFGGGVVTSVFIFILILLNRRASEMAVLARQSEAAMRRQNADLNTILEHLPGGVTLVGPDFNLLRFNQKFSRLFDIDEASLVGQKTALPELIRRHTVAGDAAAEAPALDLTKHGYDLECHLSNQKTIQIHGTALQSGGMVTFYADITQRRAQELQLRKLSAAVDQSPSSTLITDVDGRIEYVNAAFLQLTGYRAEEVIGNNPRMLSSGQTRPDTYRQMWPTLQRGEKWLGEFTNKRKDGSIYINQATISAIRSADGRITHYVSVQEDITDRKRTEAELAEYRQNLEQLVQSRTAELVVERDRAESAVRAKSEFLSNMSHEIRTPIHAVMGFAMICLRAELPPRVLDHVRKIAQASESLLAIVNDILDASKLEADKLELEHVEFDLGDVLVRTGNLFGLKAAEKGIELVIGSEPEVPELLTGDGYRLGQVLTNLVGNAIKFTDAGEVRVEVSLARRTADAVTLLFKVHDTGIGMSQDQAAQLFTAFQQADNSITRKYGGSGLGLAISRQLVEKMGGQLGLESQPGQGTTFQFSACFGVPGSSQTGAEIVNSLAGKKVLVVEDNALMRRLHTLNMSSFGCRVVAEESGEAALQTYAGGAPFDFVVLDFHLPGIDGLETAHRLSQAGHRGHTILITADSVDVAEESIACGEIQAVLPKPVSRRLLREMLKSLIDVERPAQLEVAVSNVSAPDFSGRRILVVDDNEFNREIAVSFIRTTGAAADSAEDGEAAVRAASEKKYDLVLMDIQMPVMDGYTAASILRQQYPALPIVALTANAMADERARVLAAGMLGILTKPFMPAALYETIGTWIGGVGGDTDGPAKAAAHNLATDAVDAAQTTPAPVVFDHALALLRCHDQPAILARFLGLFVEQNQRSFGELSGAMQAADVETARRLAHSMKSGAGMVGLCELQHCAEVLETALLKTSRDESAIELCQPCFEQLGAAWGRAQIAAAPLLETPPAG